jgi:hypothetical protein
MTTTTTAIIELIAAARALERVSSRPGPIVGADMDAARARLDAARAVLERSTTIVIGIEGGVVQGASCDGVVHDNILILDYDARSDADEDDDRVVEIPDPAFPNHPSVAWDIDPMPVEDPAFVERVLDAIRQRDATLDEETP